MGYTMKEFKSRAIGCSWNCLKTWRIKLSAKFLGVISQNWTDEKLLSLLQSTRGCSLHWGHFHTGASFHAAHAAHTNVTAVSEPWLVATAANTATAAVPLERSPSPFPPVLLAPAPKLNNSWMKKPKVTCLCSQGRETQDTKYRALPTLKGWGLLCSTQNT